MKTCIQRAWLTTDGHIVGEGHEDAAVLIAHPGQSIHESKLADYPEEEVEAHFVDKESYQAPEPTPIVHAVNTSVSVVSKVKLERIKAPHADSHKGKKNKK